MVQVSKHKLREETLEKLFNLFLEVFLSQHYHTEMQNVVSDIFSPIERLVIAKRIAIVYLLLKNIDHRTICTVLKVSNATVSKFSLLSEKSVGLPNVLKKMIRNDKLKLFLENLYASFFAVPGQYGNNWKVSREWKKGRERRK